MSYKNIIDPDDIPEVDPMADAQRTWLAEIKAAQKELNDWHEQANKTVDRYLDTRGTLEKTDRRFNLFAANVSVLQSALFARIPKPVAERRFRSTEDQIGRVAALLIERGLQTELETDGYFATIIKDVIKDRLIPGCGVVWVRYVPTYKEGEPLQPTTSLDDELKEGDEGTEVSQILASEQTPVEHVVWKDFLYSPCRTWSECRWVARAVHMNTDEVVERFGQDIADDICATPDEQDESVTTNKIVDDYMNNRVVETVKVWEIWCKESKKVYFINEDSTKALDVKDDPFGLPHFFPTPKPLMGITSTLKYVPKSDYAMVQDQYEDLNTINSRISNLVRACKVAGAYDKSNAAIGQVFSPNSPETILVPVDRWDAFAEKGGIKGAIDFVPIDQIAAVIEQLNNARENVKAQIYELTGISDIIRGQSSAYETLGAQNIKAQYAGLRLQTMQTEVAEFMSELVQIKAFLMAKFYTPERLVQKAGPLLAADQQYLAPAVSMLKNELLAHTNIQITVDSLQLQTDLQDKQERGEVVQATTMLMKEAAAAGAIQPGTLGPLMMQLMKFGIASFKGARDIEGAIDQELQRMMTPIQNGQQPQQKPDPVMVQAQMVAQQAQAKMQLDQQKMQIEAQIEQAKIQANAQIEQAKIQANAQIEQMKLEQAARFKSAELELEARKLNIEEARVNQSGVLEVHKLQQKQVPQTTVSNGLDEAKVAELFAGLQQTTLDALAQMSAKSQEPSTVTVKRDKDGNLVGIIN